MAAYIRISGSHQGKLALFELASYRASPLPNAMLFEEKIGLLAIFHTKYKPIDPIDPDRTEPSKLAIKPLKSITGSLDQVCLICTGINNLQLPPQRVLYTNRDLSLTRTRVVKLFEPGISKGNSHKARISKQKKAVPLNGTAFPPSASIALTGYWIVSYIKDKDLATLF
ncbi:hypothetical protein [Marinobacterium jannaschii]